MSVQATIAFLLSLAITVQPVSSAAGRITEDASVTNAISAIQDALPPGSLAVFGAWAVLQYTEVWNVDDGPLSGAIAWWRWNFWMPPTANNPRLSSTEPPISGSGANGTESQSLLHAPTISYSNLITCWMFLLLITTPIQRGIFWDNYGSYAVALFTGFIVSWRSLSKFVVATPIPEGSHTEDAYHRTIVTEDIHDDKSRALNALSRFPTASVYGIMARKELRRITPANVLDFLSSQTLCSQCRQVVEGQGGETETSWNLVLDLLEQHDKDMNCAVHHRRFRWMRSHSGREEPLYCDDPNIAHAIAIGGLGAWRLQKSTFVRQLRHFCLFLSIAIPLSFNYQIIWALLEFKIPVFGRIGRQKDGSPLYFPLNNVVRNGIYLADRTLVRPLPSMNAHWTSQIQYILGLIFVAFGVMTFGVASLEALAAQLHNPSSIFSTRTLRMMSCYIMALSSFSVGLALSFALGYDLSESVWRTGLQYTLSLLISGVCLGASYAWRAHHGTMGDDKSWVTPPLPQRRLVTWLRSFSTWANVHVRHAITALIAFCIRSCVR